MPAHVDTSLLGADAPKGPHFALRLGEDAMGSSLAIPPGAMLWIVEDAKDPKRIFPLYLISISHRELVFHCHCADKECTRIVRFKGKWTGFHHSQFENAPSPR